MVLKRRSQSREERTKTALIAEIPDCCRRMALPMGQGIRDNRGGSSIAGVMA